MNIVPSTAIKSTGFATLLFWVLLLSNEKHGEETYAIIFFSIIPIFIICFLAIILTIMPFYWLEEYRLNSIQIFNKYFPYYSIVSFGICSYYIIISNFGSVEVSFFTTAFFTSISAWVWLFKTKKK